MSSIQLDLMDVFFFICLTQENEETSLSYTQSIFFTFYYGKHEIPTSCNSLQSKPKWDKLIWECQ